jgi:hypothetical protein
MTRGTAPDFSGYDLEYAELVGMDWRKQFGEIELKLRCPVAGWSFKEKKVKVLDAVGLNNLVEDPCVGYLITLIFLGVTEVSETLISQGHTVTGHGPSDDTWLRSFIFEVDDIRSVELNEGFRFYPRAENLHLDFNFKDCIFTQNCIEK